MKTVKGIGLFLVYPLTMLALGFFAGVKAVEFFYPGGLEQRGSAQEILLPGARQEQEGAAGDTKGNKGNSQGNDPGNSLGNMTEGHWFGSQEDLQVSAGGDTLCVDTEYVVEETDILRDSVVESVGRLPGKYVGMNREQFLKAMETYEKSPPLSEQERGFAGLEVLSFSRERVVVRMDYKYVQPSSSFYLGVVDNEVIVYLEDKETVYINTGIQISKLPEDVQIDIIQMMWVENEESLYDFLEANSS